MTKPTTLTTELTLKQLLQTATQRLAAVGCDTPKLDAEVLLAYTLDQERTWLFVHPEAQLTPDQEVHYFNLIAHRAQREPVPYLTGHREFFGLDFTVTPDTLIPRPETELLIETTLEFFQSSPQNPKIVDVGTGSGCIAITLAKQLPQTQLVAIDASGQALAVAQGNAVRHGVADRIEFRQGDLLQPLSEAVEVIVSNPPYVSQAHLASPYTSPEVHRYEPRLALDGGSDGLNVIRQLLPQAQKLLKSNGCLLVEIGAKQGQAIKQLAQAHFPQAHVEVKKDLAGLDRLLVVDTMQ